MSPIPTPALTGSGAKGSSEEHLRLSFTENNQEKSNHPQGALSF